MDTSTHTAQACRYVSTVLEVDHSVPPWCLHVRYDITEQRGSSAEANVLATPAHSQYYTACTHNKLYSEILYRCACSLLAYTHAPLHPFHSLFPASPFDCSIWNSHYLLKNHLNTPTPCPLTNPTTPTPLPTHPPSGHTHTPYHTQSYHAKTSDTRCAYYSVRTHVHTVAVSV